MRLLPFASLLLCGCYVAVPMSTTTPPAGTRLQVQLTDAGSSSLAQYLGPNVVSVDGRLMARSDSSLTLSVTDVGMRSGDQQFWKGEQVSIPQVTIATVQQKKLSWWRSGLIGGLLVAGALSINAASGGSAGAPRSGPPPGSK
jgi:hypothetical protein